MGVSYSFASPPPGAMVLTIQERTCGATCANRVWDNFMSKPPHCAGWPESRWAEFRREMGSLVNTFKKDGYAHFALLLIVVGVMILLIGVVSPRGEDEDSGFGFMNIIHVPFIFISILIFMSINSTWRRHNMAVDARIEALCRRYSDAAVTLQYATEFTQVCKPKGAQTYRALFICPGSGTMGIEAGVSAVGVPVPAQLQPQMTSVQVTCPEGKREYGAPGLERAVRPFRPPFPRNDLVRTTRRAAPA